jgi:hypothetical protein
MVNIVVHITLPRGMRLLPVAPNGPAILEEPVTFDVVSALSPFYASVKQVQLAGGMYISRLSDLTIASEIYEVSKDVDLLCLHPPTNPATDSGMRFLGSRESWVAAKAARDLLLGVSALIGAPGVRTLANMSISRSRGLEGESISERVSSLNKDIALYDVTIRSCGSIVPGGHAKAGMAAKGVMDWSEKTPSRTWKVTGLGANAMSLDFGSPTGGRGKPVAFYSHPYYSPPFISLRMGIYQGAYPLIVTNPWPNSI